MRSSKWRNFALAGMPILFGLVAAEACAQEATVILGDYVNLQKQSPAPAPVIVDTDEGGFLYVYVAQTKIYRLENREVRIRGICRSACGMALSLPKTCVYPEAMFEFHAAYNRYNLKTEKKATALLFSSYPKPVRRKLGRLTKNIQSLSGEQLIKLGVPKCLESENPSATSLFFDPNRIKYMRPATVYNALKSNPQP